MRARERRMLRCVYVRGGPRSWCWPLFCKDLDDRRDHDRLRVAHHAVHHADGEGDICTARSNLFSKGGVARRWPNVDLTKAFHEAALTCWGAIA